VKKITDLIIEELEMGLPMKTRTDSIIEKLELAFPTEGWPAVSVQGQSLSDVYWHRRQWAVTKHGLEARDGSYEISADRLWEKERFGGWVQHMSLKKSVDAEDFIVCLAVARLIHVAHAPST
jgi:hypothetical protein